eukprot:tig00020614_g12194.t1
MGFVFQPPFNLARGVLYPLTFYLPKETAARVEVIAMSLLLSPLLAAIVAAERVRLKIQARRPAPPRQSPTAAPRPTLGRAAQRPHVRRAILQASGRASRAPRARSPSPPPAAPAAAPAPAPAAAPAPGSEQAAALREALRAVIREELSQARALQRSAAEGRRVRVEEGPGPGAKRERAMAQAGVLVGEE